MTAEQPDDAMVEIGDIEDEATPAPAVPPRVIIEYRDRGVPWMLLPPLLAVAAVVAVVIALTLNAKWNARRPVVVVNPVPVVDTPPEPIAAAPPDQVLPPSSVPDPKVVEQAPPVPGGDEAPRPRPTAPVVVTVAVGEPVTAGATDPAGATAPPPEAPPKVPLGFDPALLTAQPVNAEDGRDPAVAQAGQPEVAAPAPPAPEQPELVDPGLMPPDPRLARIDRQRRSVDARRKLEQERAQFHADLSLTIRRLGNRSAPAIHALCQEYEQDIPPSALEQAKKALGKTGMYAGANTSERIALLRKIGFPETKILGDIYDIQTRHESPDGRHTPTQDEMYVQSAMLLLKHPPNRSATSTRAVSNPRANSRTRPDPNALAPTP